MKTLAEMGINLGELNIKNFDNKSILTAVSDDGEKIVVGYLFADEFCESPLESSASDGNGHIHTSHRHATRDSHAQFQKARGLDSEWQPNLGLVDDGSDMTQDNLMKKWTEALSAGTIGDPLAITLDIYDHGGVAYSLSGEGNNCQWDTVTGGAIWVPDDESLENISLIAIRNWLKEMNFDGDSIDIGWEPAGKNYFTITTDGKTTRETGFNSMSWAMKAAADKLCALAGKELISDAAIQIAMKASAREYVKPVLEEYNAWLAGDTWAYTVTEYERATTKSGLVTYIEDQSKRESVHGFIGSDYVENQMKESFDHEVLSIDASVDTPVPAM